MAKFKQLYDLYRFPGFVPHPHVRGIFGDPGSVVILLRRRQKKRYVLSVASSIGLATISALDVLGISLVAIRVSISNSTCEESGVYGAAA
jgi:hypothetical protein